VVGTKGPFLGSESNWQGGSEFWSVAPLGGLVRRLESVKRAGKSVLSEVLLLALLLQRRVYFFAQARNLELHSQDKNHKEQN